jgi:hypothetical protein
MAVGVVRRHSQYTKDNKKDDQCAYFLWDSSDQTWDNWELTSKPWGDESLGYESLLSVAATRETVFVGTVDGIVVGVLGSDDPEDYTHYGLRPADDSDTLTYVLDITVSDGVIYAATSAGLWYSLDNGTSWLHIGTGDGLPGDHWNAVATVKNRVYLASDGYGIAELVWQ